MSARTASPVGHRVADHLRTAAPWEVFGERARRYELHFNGRVIESVRGPLLVEGYGIRIFRPHGERTGTGFKASTDTTAAGVAQAASDAEKVATFSDFPTKRVDLPASSSPRAVEVVDRPLWEAPMPRIEAYVTALLAPFDGIKDAVPSFGSVRATLTETSLANSAGLRTAYEHTTIGLEVAVKAFGGPEGAPPGEYWVNQVTRSIDPVHAGDPVASWCQFAQDARRAKPPPTGDMPVVLPPDTLSGILPNVIGFRWSGGARLREIAPTPGSVLAAADLSIFDDGGFPWGPNTAPVDDEGTRVGRRPLIHAGAVAELMYDTLHAGAFDVRATGNALRGLSFGRRDWMRFTGAPATGPTTMVVEPGSGGSDAEIAEAAGDGIWVQQLGWASPDPISGSFGGEIRIGYRIRNGKLAEPVRGGVVGGSVVAAVGSPSMLTQVTAIGSKAILSDYLSSPTLLVGSLTVAGETVP
jgi:predicted Zn-dependent protease